MKLRNKKTGEIVELRKNEEIIIPLKDEDGDWYEECYDSITELNKEWEDYEEPKGSALELMILTLTNFIENEPDEDKVDLEDCKQMLDKLKAWERLKDKGFRFTGINDKEDSQLMIYQCGILCEANIEYRLSQDKDFKLLFGDEK